MPDRGCQGSSLSSFCSPSPPIHESRHKQSDGDGERMGGPVGGAGASGWRLAARQQRTKVGQTLTDRAARIHTHTHTHTCSSTPIHAYIHPHPETIVDFSTGSSPVACCCLLCPPPQRVYLIFPAAPDKDLIYDCVEDYRKVLCLYRLLSPWRKERHKLKDFLTRGSSSFIAKCFLSDAKALETFYI